MKNNILTTITIHTIATVIGAGIFYWYNHVLYHTQLSYFQWLCFSTINYMFFSNKQSQISPVGRAHRHIVSIVFLICIVLQVGKWIGVNNLPLF
jgi:hypothetical protein